MLFKDLSLDGNDFKLAMKDLNRSVLYIRIETDCVNKLHAPSGTQNYPVPSHGAFIAWTGKHKDFELQPSLARPVG